MYTSAKLSYKWSNTLILRNKAYFPGFNTENISTGTPFQWGSKKTSRMLPVPQGKLWTKVIVITCMITKRPGKSRSLQRYLICHLSQAFILFFPP